MPPFLNCLVLKHKRSDPVSAHTTTPKSPSDVKLKSNLSATILDLPLPKASQGTHGSQGSQGNHKSHPQHVPGQHHSQDRQDSAKKHKKFGKHGEHNKNADYKKQEYEKRVVEELWGSQPALLTVSHIHPSILSIPHLHSSAFRRPRLLIANRQASLSWSA